MVEPTYYWVIGVGLAILASFISNFGVNLQKLTHIRRNKGIAKAKVYSREPLWIMGLMFVILGSFADFAALEFGAQSIITPLGSLTLVANVCIAPRMLGEEIGFRDYFSTVVIMIGSMISVAFADHVDEQFTASQIYSFFIATRFVVLFISTLLFMLIMWVTLQYCEYVAQEKGESSLEYQKLIKVHRFLYAALSGTVGAQNVLFAKCFVEILVDWFYGGPFLFAHWQTYVILVCLGSTIFLQIRWMNDGLQRFDALFIVPVFQSFWIGISVITGLVFFGEWDAMAVHERAGFPFGVLITVCGLFVLTRRQVNLQTKTSPDTPIEDGITHSNGHGHYAKNGEHRYALPAEAGQGYSSDEESSVVGLTAMDGVEIQSSDDAGAVKSNGHHALGNGTTGHRRNGHGGVFGPRIEDYGVDEPKDGELDHDRRPSGLLQFGSKLTDLTRKLTSSGGSSHGHGGHSHRRRRSSGRGDAIDGEDDGMDTAFDVKLGLMGTGAPASIGGSAVFRTASVLKPERLLSNMRRPRGFQPLDTDDRDSSDENSSNSTNHQRSNQTTELGSSATLTSRVMNTFRRSSGPPSNKRGKSNESDASYAHLSSSSPDSKSAAPSGGEASSTHSRSRKSPRSRGEANDLSTPTNKSGMSENLLDEASDS